MPRRPPEGRRFKKGQSGNPKGSTKATRELGAIRRMSAEQVAEIGTMLLNNKRQELRALAESDTASFLQVWTASLMMKGYAQGNPQIYTAVMDRVIGKPKEQREISGPDGKPIEITDPRSLEEKAARAEMLRKMRLALGGDEG